MNPTIENNQKLSFHEIISKKITNLLDILYYNNLNKLYNETLRNIFKNVPFLLCVLKGQHRKF